MTEERKSADRVRQQSPSQRSRRRRETRQQRMRRQKRTRLLVYILLLVLAILLVLALISIFRKVKRDREAQVIEEAMQEEISQSDFYAATEVLHLSFPVLTLDMAETGSMEPETDETEETSAGEDLPVAESAAPSLTVSAFRDILQDLYERNYVLVDVYDLAETTEEGFAAAEVMVPAGKKPLILSQQDVSYTTEEDGKADALVRDSSGQVVCAYTNAAGTALTGAADVVPVLEAFIQEHPEFSYKGARGILGVTGYRGLFGYQIEKDDHILSSIPIEDVVQTDAGTAAVGDLVGEGTGVEVEEVEPESEADGSRPVALSGATDSDAIIAQNKETIGALLGALRANGWHIASNSYALISYGSSYGIMQKDAAEWQRVLEPLVGTTDILLLPDRADIGNWSGYTEENPRYTLLQEQGFRYYCIENEETETWAQIRPDYVRQGMHTIDSQEAYTAIFANE